MEDAGQKLKCVRTGAAHQEHDDTQQAETAETPIRADAAEALQDQVLALQQQLAARDAEVAALKQSEPSATQPAGQSSRTPEPGPSKAAEKKKVPSKQVGLGALWKMTMTRTIGASQYQQPCRDADRGTVKMYVKQKEAPYGPSVCVPKGLHKKIKKC